MIVTFVSEGAPEVNTSPSINNPSAAQMELAPVMQVSNF